MRRPCLACGAATDPTRPCLHCGTARRNGSTRQWRQVRGLVFDRDDDRCTRCGRRGPLEVHHLVPVVEGGSMALDNLTVLCEHCHHAAH